MSVQYEDSVMEFDLDFLHQSPNKSEIYEKPDLSERSRKAILVVKKKVIATDSLIRKFYEKREEVEQFERALHTSKEECKQACIDFQNLTKKYQDLEKESQVLRISNVNLQEQSERTESLYGAMQSHANQLQILVQENETTIESLKVENQLYELNVKDCEKKVLTLQKENDDLKKHLCLMRDIIFGKKKLSSRRKEILNKYDQYYAIDDDEDSVFGDDSGDEILELGAESVVEDNIKRQHLASKKDNEHDSDCSNELTSADTGRGSSLASSDVEKCFNSPDYFLNNSPINENNDKEKRSYTDSTTSPIKFNRFVDMATSPLPTHKNMENGLSLVINENNDLGDNLIESEFEISTTNNEPNVIENSIFEPDNDFGVNKSIAEKLSNESSILINICSPSNSLAEPISLNCSVPAENTSSALSNYSLVFDDNNPLNICRPDEEKECLELNKRDNYDNTNTEDCEVEAILNTMRFNRRLLTPLPSTPSKSHKGSKTSHFSGMKCKDAAKVKADSQILSTKYFELAQELKELKDILRNKCILDVHDGTKVDNGGISKEQLANVDKSNQVTENCVITTHFKQPSLLVVEKIREPIKETIKAPTEIIEQVLPNKSVETAPEALLLPPVRSSKSLLAEILDIEPLNTETHLNSETHVETSPSEVENITGDAVFPQKNENREQEHVTHVKHRKLSKLEKLRKKLVPKSKIKKYTAQKLHSKLRIKPKQLPLYRTKVMACETNAKLNNKRAYEKALKVLNELKTKQKVGKNKELNLPNNTDHAEMDAIKKHSVPENLTKTDQRIFGSPEPKSLRYNMQTKPIDTNYVSKNINKTVQSNNTTANIIEKNNLYVILEKIDQSIKYFPNRNNELVSQISKSTSPTKTITTRSYSKNAQEVNGEKHATAREDSIKVQKENSATLCKTNEIQQSTKRRQTRKSVESYEMARTSVEKVNDVSECAHVQQSHVQEESSGTTKKYNENSQSTKKRQKRGSVDSNKVLSEYINERRDVCGSEDIKKIDISRPVAKMNDIQQSHVQEERSGTTKKCNENPQSTKKRQNRGSVDSNKVLSEYVNERRDVCGSEDIKKIDTSKPVAKMNDIQQGTRKRKNRVCVDSSEMPRKRILRSSTLRQSQSDISSISSDTDTDITTIHVEKNARKMTTTLNSLPRTNALNYSDLDLFTSDNVTSSQKTSEKMKGTNNNPKGSIFCAMMEKYGKQSTKNYAKKIPESVITSTCKILQEEIRTITTLPANEANNAMNKFVDIVKSWDHKIFISGLMAYLKDSQRKIELYNKISSPPAPAMTKSEQVLLYVISQLTISRSCLDILDSILCNIEYVLFKLNRTPEFDVIECMSHFYAVLCRYFKLKSRLRLFMLDAMYCIQFKAVPLIKQCLEVWMHVLPLAHMGIAKSPLVTCMVYLLHFYKCDDRFQRVQDIRYILNRKYFYEITEWNEPKIMEMFRSAIKDIRAVPIETKLLRIALIVISKRHGAKWCQQNIVKKLLLPLLDTDVPERVKIFCINMLGPLLKPYPADMKMHCEIVINQLEDMLKQNPSHQIQEAIITSLVYISKQNSAQVLQTLLSWRPQEISPELENVLRDFVAEKPLRVWKSILSKVKPPE